MTAILYYDGRCGLCAREIARLERLRDDGLALCDIHTLDAEPEPGEPDRDTLLRTLHLRTDDGRWLTGADANVAAWRHTRYGWLWGWLRWPLLRRLVDPVYAHWAAWRYRRLYGDGCATGSCHVPEEH
ncbi:thiol-disulfide oxidoreductase DCC family protein [Pseudohaliea rubra]|nr:DUF393 domain-containing protein [Pseudohaliea rubra]